MTETAKPRIYAKPGFTSIEIPDFVDNFADFRLGFFHHFQPPIGIAVVACGNVCQGQNTPPPKGNPMKTVAIGLLTLTLVALVMQPILGVLFGLESWLYLSLRKGQK